MTEIIIRDLKKSDHQDWLVLWSQYLGFYETNISDEMKDIAFNRLISDDENEYKGLIALLNLQPIGLAHTLTHRHGWYKEKVVYLQDLFVSKKARNKGVARSLIEEIYHRADKANTPNVYWTTRHNNIEARKLYDKIARNSGFIKYQR